MTNKEDKKLKAIELSQDSNSIDTDDAPNSKAHLGSKSMEQLQLENERLAAELAQI